mgnify:CR=1 FL=1
MTSAYFVNMLFVTAREGGRVSLCALYIPYFDTRLECASTTPVFNEDMI